MSERHTIISGFVCAGGFLIGLACGCSSKPEFPPTYPVTGTVMMGGKPVDGARIVLVPKSEDGESAAGIADNEGKFSITTRSAGDGAEAGEYMVSVTKYNVAPPTEEERVVYMTLEEENAAYIEDEKPIPPARNLLPKKYQTPAMSGITLTVKDAPATLDIVLE